MCITKSPKRKNLSLFIHLLEFGLSHNASPIQKSFTMYSRIIHTALHCYQITKPQPGTSSRHLYTANKRKKSRKGAVIDPEAIVAPDQSGGPIQQAGFSTAASGAAQQAMDFLVELRDETLKSNSMITYQNWRARWISWCEYRQYPTGRVLTFQPCQNRIELT
jgi:hypothetical protein